MISHSDILFQLFQMKETKLSILLVGEKIHFELGATLGIDQIVAVLISNWPRNKPTFSLTIFISSPVRRCDIHTHTHTHKTHTHTHTLEHVHTYCTHTYTHTHTQRLNNCSLES